MSVGVILKTDVELHKPTFEIGKYYYNSVTELVLLLVDTYPTDKVQGVIMNSGKNFGRLTLEDRKQLKPWYGTITITSQP